MELADFQSEASLLEIINSNDILYIKRMLNNKAFKDEKVLFFYF